MGHCRSNSYDFTNKVRDVSRVFETLIAESTSFMSLLPIIGGVSNFKHEWIDDQLTPTKSALTANSDIADTTIDLADTTGIQVGSVLRFTSITGVTRSVKVIVTEVTSATVVTVTRPFGGTTDVNLLDTDICILESTPRQEGSDAVAGESHEGVAAYNQTQIFDANYEVSKTSNVSGAYDDYTRVNMQAIPAMDRIKRDLENALIHGVRVSRTSSAPGTLGGLLWNMSQSGSIKTSISGAVSETIVNNHLAEINENGGASNNYLILCAVNQARRLSALSVTSENPIIQKSYPDTNLGQYVNRFWGDFATNVKGSAGQNMSARIWSSFTMPADQLLILDMNKIAIKAMRSMTDEDATLPGADKIKRRLLTELTLEVRNSLHAHALLTDLTV